MKKIVLLVLLAGSVTATFAKVIKINVTDFQFVNKTVNAKVGDTIHVGLGERARILQRLPLFRRESHPGIDL